MPDALSTIRARLPPGPLADALQALIESARDVGRFHADEADAPDYHDAKRLDLESAQLTALLDLLAPMQRSHEAMEALRHGPPFSLEMARRSPDVWRTSSGPPVYQEFCAADPADAILAAAAKGRVE